MKHLLRKLGFIGFLALGYWILPNLYARKISNKVMRKYKVHNREIYLTFDDGPHPVYTSLLLDLLHRENIKATFFVVAKNAVKHPALLKRMINEGHEVGLHSLKHKGFWQMMPLETLHELKNALSLLRPLLGNKKIRYFRPPWGTFNLLTLIAAHREGLQTVLWSVDVSDWEADTTGDIIKQRLLEKVRRGDIIVLHDSGGAPASPLRMIDGLEKTIPILREQGYHFALLKEENV